MNWVVSKSPSAQMWAWWPSTSGRKRPPLPRHPQLQKGVSSIYEGATGQVLGVLTQPQGIIKTPSFNDCLSLDPAAKAYPSCLRTTAASLKLADASVELVLGSPADRMGLTQYRHYYRLRTQHFPVSWWTTYEILLFSPSYFTIHHCNPLNPVSTEEGEPQQCLASVREICTLLRFIWDFYGEPQKWNWSLSRSCYHSSKLSLRMKSSSWVTLAQMAELN